MPVVTCWTSREEQCLRKWRGHAQLVHDFGSAQENGRHPSVEREFAEQPSLKPRQDSKHLEHAYCRGEAVIIVVTMER